MQRTFLSNLVILILLNVLVKPLWVLGIDVKVQNMLGPEVYGDYFSLVNFAFLFTVVLDFGINNYNNRKISRDPTLIHQTLIESSVVKMILAVVFSIVLLIGAQLMGYSSAELSMLKYISLMLFLQSFLMFLRSNLSGIQWYRADVFVSILDKGLMILIIAAMIWSSVLDTDFSILHFILGQCLAYGIAILVVLLLLLIKVKKFSFSLNLNRVKTILKESSPYALLTFLMLVYFKVDAVMIERMMFNGDEQAGIYAQSYKLLDAAVMFTFLFSSLLLPMFSKMIAAKESVKDLVHLSTKVMGVPSFILVVIMTFFGGEFMESMYTTAAEQSAIVFPVLMASLLPLGASYIFGTLITAEGDLKFLNRISIGAIGVNILLNYLLIPSIGLMGAAVATLVTQSVVSIVQWVSAAKRHDVKYTNLGIAKAVLFGSVTVLITWVMTMADLPWVMSVIIVFILGLVTAFSCGLLTIRLFKEVLTYQR